MNNNQNKQSKGNAYLVPLLTLIVAPVIVALVTMDSPPWWSSSDKAESSSKESTAQVVESTPSAEPVPSVESPSPAEPTAGESTASEPTESIESQPAASPSPAAVPPNEPAPTVNTAPASPERSISEAAPSRLIDVTGTNNTVSDNSVNVTGSQNSVNITKASEARARGEFDVPSVAGMSYNEARTLILAEGWMPQMQHWSYAQDVSITGGNGPIFWEKGYTEVEACAGTAYGNCRFVFADAGGRQLTVFTRGMEIPEQGIEAQVTNLDLGERQW